MKELDLKEHIYRIFEEKEKAYNQRFASQEKSIETAEHARDVAIKKAEDSIEKKSDIAYVKIQDLQKALTEVMLRPEVESRFAAIAKDIAEIKEALAQLSGRDTGKGEGWKLFLGIMGVLPLIAAIIYALSK